MMNLPRPFTLAPLNNEREAVITLKGDIGSVSLFATGDVSLEVEYHVAGGGNMVTPTRAARFLAQSALGTTQAEIDGVVASGYAGWLDAQFATPRASTFWDWLVAKGYYPHKNYSGDYGYEAMVWSSLITGKDQLRQRVALALFNMLVVSTESIPAHWIQFGMAAYMDILWNGAFGNYRDILGNVTTNAAMGQYLSMMGSKRASASGSQPDENFARELMQLFTIGPVDLKQDGTASGGESYTNADVTGLARVCTGWDWHRPWSLATPEMWKRPMVMVEADHESGAKSFLGTTIPAGTNGAASLALALDALFAHPNVAPFVSKHLIQNLVTSNPSPAYVGRIAKVFANDGTGVRGDLKAVVRAILLDDEARADPSGNTAGILREPLLRFVSWARTFGASSPSDTWPIIKTEWLGQRVGRAPSVFNFFRPGYAPPNSAIADAGLVAPVFQITDEQSVIKYIDFMIVTMRDGSGDFKADYTEWLMLDTNALLARLNLTMTSDQVSAATRLEMFKAVESVKLPLDRVFAATTLIMATPEYLVLK